tara:strand:- start:66 stop:461 length:396 start_codon:yes stop_codon:yes gene_type:complete
MNIKSKNLERIVFVLIIWAACAAFLIYKQSVEKELADAIESKFEDRWISAKTYLVLATAIRDNRLQSALKFAEDSMENEVLYFTHNGKNLGGLTKFETSTIKQVQDYWEKSCNRECLISIEPILNNEIFEQ